MRKNIVAGNWKMNTTVPEGVQLAKDVCAAVAAEANLKCDVIVGVPFTHLTAVKEAIGLENVTAKHLRGEEERGRYDFVVSRAVMPLPDLVKIVRKNISKTSHNSIANGILCLKGGNVESEVQPFRKVAEVTPLSNWFEEEWFKEKHLIYLPI